VPLGITLQNQAKGNDMTDILTHLHQYVPQVPYTVEKTMSVHTKEAQMHKILVGGDQMTAARTRAVLSSRSNGETPSNRLEGLIPLIEDWHTTANFLGVRLYYIHYVIQNTTL